MILDDWIDIVTYKVFPLGGINYCLELSDIYSRNIQERDLRLLLRHCLRRHLTWHHSKRWLLGRESSSLVCSNYWWLRSWGIVLMTTLRMSTSVSTSASSEVSASSSGALASATLVARMTLSSSVVLRSGLIRRVGVASC